LERKGLVLVDTKMGKKHWKLIRESEVKKENLWNKVFELEKKNDYSSAISLLKRIIEIDKDDIDAIGELGYLYYQIKDYHNSLKYFIKSNQEIPQDQNTLQNIGVIYFFLKNYDKAFNFLKTSLQIDQNQPLVWYHLSKVYHSKGNDSEALISIIKSLELDPTNIKVIEFHDLLEKSIEEEESTISNSGIFSDIMLSIGSEELEITAFMELNKFEKKLREYITSVLQSKLGEDWWELGIPQNIRENVKNRIEKEKVNEPNRKYEDAEFLSFNDYYLILSYKNNWKLIFSNVFREKKHVLQTHMEMIRLTRNRAMHSRDILKEDIIKLKVAISEILKYIS